MSRNGSNSSLSWLLADIDGLEKTARRRGLAYVLFELLQNSFDTNAKNVSFTMEPVDGRPRVKVTCEDDDPDGFDDLSHSYRLFAESNKKAHVDKRGRWNSGEKFVLAVCEEARVTSTKGTVIFSAGGRTESRSKRDAGTEFYGLVKMNRQELTECMEAAELIIPPDGVTTTVNGSVVPSQMAVGEFRTTLKTEVADEEGVLRPTRRQTNVRCYAPLEGRSAWLYEMGIPVVEIEFPWSVNIFQKVPLNQDRDNVPPAFLREVFVETINAMHTKLAPESAALSAVVETLADGRVTSEAADTVLTHTHGEQRALFDAKDVEAGNRLTGRGYNVIPPRGLPPGAAKNLRELGVLRTTAEISPTPKPYSTDPAAKARECLPENEWTPGMRATAKYAMALAQELLGCSISVVIDKNKERNFAACYGGRSLTFSLGSLGRNWFNGGIREELNDLLLHELSHESESNHLSERFHKACTALGAKLCHIALTKPEFFKALDWEVG